MLKTTEKCWNQENLFGREEARNWTEQELMDWSWFLLWCFVGVLAVVVFHCGTVFSRVPAVVVPRCDPVLSRVFAVPVFR
jgi:hypothetical protein